jgi:hypothetical protein
MQIRELLSEIMRLTVEIQRAKDRRNQWRSSAYRVSSGLSLSLRQARGGGDCRHERALLEGDAVACEVAEMEAALGKLREELSPRLGALALTKVRTVLRCRYLEGMSCVQIGLQMNYSRAQVYRLLEAGERELRTGPEE